ncbi:hypothetical protein H8959_006774 [Pygathrix nigripes]
MRASVPLLNTPSLFAPRALAPVAASETSLDHQSASSCSASFFVTLVSLGENRDLTHLVPNLCPQPLAQVLVPTRCSGNVG